eukprot:5150342-Amphidinium_carterae.1
MMFARRGAKAKVKRAKVFMNFLRTCKALIRRAEVCVCVFVHSAIHFCLLCQILIVCLARLSLAAHQTVPTSHTQTIRPLAREKTIQGT